MRSRMPIEARNRLFKVRPASPVTVRFAEGDPLERLLGYTWYQQPVPHDVSGFHCYKAGS